VAYMETTKAMLAPGDPDFYRKMGFYGGRHVRSLPVGIAVSEQLHGALEIGEEHSDELALAFEGTLGGEDLLSEMLGGIGVGRRKPAAFWVDARRGSQGLTALLAELMDGCVRGPALRAQSSEFRAALRTELSVRRSFLLAPRTFHAGHLSDRRT